MAALQERECAVAVVGGGPAGISACLELGRRGVGGVTLFENESRVGGIPRSAHIFFGMRDQHRAYTGPAYARRLERLLAATSTQVCTLSTVIEILPDADSGSHTLVVSSERGLELWRARAVLLACGCFEGSRESRLIPGQRPAGVFTTGTLQKLVNLRGLKPGKRAVILGSEHVAFSAALTLRHAGAKVAALIEPQEALQTYALAAKPLSLMMGFPIHLGASISQVRGKGRVQGLELEGGPAGMPRSLDCDTLVVTGCFRPESALLHGTGLAMDPATRGPMVDANYQTSCPGVFAAGNLLRGADMHDLCALEGRRAGASLAAYLRGQAPGGEGRVELCASDPLRFVVPQWTSRVVLQGNKPMPGHSFQMARSMRGVTVEAVSDSGVVWSRAYRRLIANNRVALPVERFAWERIKPGARLCLRVRP